MIKDVSNIEKVVNDFERTTNSILLKPIDRYFGETIKLVMSTDDPVAFIHYQGVCAGIAIAAHLYGLLDKESLLNIVNSLMNMKFPEGKEAAE